MLFSEVANKNNDNDKVKIHMHLKKNHKKNYFSKKVVECSLIRTLTHCQNTWLSPELYYLGKGKRSELSQQSVRISANKIPGAYCY